MGQSASQQLQNQLVNLKLTSKQLTRSSQRCTKNETKAKNKLKQAIEQGNMEGARIYAQNAIREKNQSLNFLRLASRVDAVASRVETALRMNNLSDSMAGVVKGMDKALASMDVEKISRTMDKFEQQFEDLDVRSGYMEGAMSNTTSLSTPQEEVDGLIQMVADEHGLALGAELDEAGAVGTGVPEVAAPVAAAAAPAESDLEARLAALRK